MEESPEAMPPDDTGRAARIDRVVASYELLMHRIASSHAPDLMEVGVTMSQAKVMYLVAAGQGMRMSELATHLGVSISTMSGLVDRLVDHGLLARHDDPTDRRQVVVTITKTGSGHLERFRELNAAGMRRLLARLEGDELGVVEHATRLLAAAADDERPIAGTLTGANSNQRSTLRGDHS
jgi:DNA-binding MarR family transcriptional regulator